jgi:glycosyltransferase involved in cell wall biosynthesis
MKNSDLHPRVLVVNGGPFEYKTNHGIVMSSLFKGWPKDRLAEIYFSQLMEPEFDVCEQYWRVTRLNVLKSMMGKTSSGILNPKQFPNGDAVSTTPSDQDVRTPCERLLGRISSFQVRTLFNEIIYKLPSVFSSRLRAWIDRFQPDLVFSMLGSGALLHANLKISRLWNIPCVPYFTDDWISWLYKDHFLAISLRTGLERLFKKYLSRSPIRITVSKEMSEEFIGRYGGAFIPNLYPYDPPSISGPPIQRESTDRVRFIYLGSFQPDRWRTLKMLGEVLAKLDAEGIRGELLIYSFPGDIKTFGDALRMEPVSRVMGTAVAADGPGIQQSADVLVHVESFGLHGITQARLSFSTKIPQYLFAKKCILAFGPPEVASMRYFVSTQTALTVTKEDPELLAAELRRLIIDKNLRQQYTEHGYQVAKENHDGDGQRERLRSHLYDACAKWQAAQTAGMC